MYLWSSSRVFGDANIIYSETWMIRLEKLSRGDSKNRYWECYERILKEEYHKTKRWVKVEIERIQWWRIYWKERKRRMRLMEKSYSLLFSFKIFPASSGFWVDQRNIAEYENVDSQYGWLTCAICTYNTRQRPIPHFPQTSYNRSSPMFSFITMNQKRSVLYI